MNIYAKRGYKVVFTHPDNGYEPDRKKVKTHLIEGEVYTIDHTEVGGWSTDVYLIEIPGVVFNSVHFSEYNEG